MPDSDRNKSGGHSHPQKDRSNNNERGDTHRTEESTTGDVLPSGEKVKSHQGVKESFGSNGPKDSH